MTGSACVPGTSAQEPSQLYEAKARFLSIASGFVEWPAATFKTANAPSEICVHGDFSFGTSLAELTRTSTMNGHRMEVKWARKDQDLPACQVLFVSHSVAKRYDKTLDAEWGRNRTVLARPSGSKEIRKSGTAENPVSAPRNSVTAV
jgi:hypothetical protein